MTSTKFKLVFILLVTTALISSSSAGYFNGFESGTAEDWYTGDDCQAFTDLEASTNYPYQGSYSLLYRLDGDNGRCAYLDLPDAHHVDNIQSITFRARVVTPGQDDHGFKFTDSGADRVVGANFDDEVYSDLEIYGGSSKCRPGTSTMDDDWYYFEFTNFNSGDSVDYYVEDQDGDTFAEGSCGSLPDTEISRIGVWASSWSDFNAKAYIDNVEIIANEKPDQPSNPNPNDGEVISDTTPQISADYNDPDGDDGTLKFYNADNDNQIGSCSTPDGGSCGVEWSGASHGDNNWYAKADDGNETTKGPTWTFTINEPPNSVDSPEEPSNGETIFGTSTTLEVQVSDPDSDTLDVEFLNNQSNLSSSERTVQNVLSGGTASIDHDSLTRGKNYTWWVKVSDDWESNTSDHWTFHVNDLPNVFGPEPEDDGVATEDDVEISIGAKDQETEELDTFYFKGNDVFIGKRTADSGEKTSIVYPDTEVGNTYEWYVNVSDGDENYTSSIKTFEKTTSESYRVQPRIDYRYSGVVLSQTNSRDVFFTLENEVSEDKQLKSYLSGVNATFAENNKDQISYTLSGDSEKKFTVNINPNSTGDKVLKMITENTELGVNTSTEIPVTVREYPAASNTAEAPGIGTVQLFMLVLVSAGLYFARL